MTINPDDLVVITVTDPVTGESFDVHLDRERAVDLAAFCEVTGLTVQEVISLSIEEFLNSKEAAMEGEETKDATNETPAEQPTSDQGDGATQDAKDETETAPTEGN